MSTKPPATPRILINPVHGPVRVFGGPAGKPQPFSADIGMQLSLWDLKSPPPVLLVSAKPRIDFLRLVGETLQVVGVVLGLGLDQPVDVDVKEMVGRARAACEYWTEDRMVKNGVFNERWERVWTAHREQLRRSVWSLSRREVFTLPRRKGRAAKTSTLAIRFSESWEKVRLRRSERGSREEVVQAIRVDCFKAAEKLLDEMELIQNGGRVPQHATNVEQSMATLLAIASRTLLSDLSMRPVEGEAMCREAMELWFTHKEALLDFEHELVRIPYEPNRKRVRRV